MLRGKLYPLVVKLQEEGAARSGSSSAAPAAAGPTVQVQPVVPGALVTPATAEIATTPGSSARFWVLPLCRGKLNDARVDFHAQGRPVQSEPLKMKVVRRRLMWVLLFLAIALPCLIAYVRATWYRTQDHLNAIGAARAWLDARGREVQEKQDTDQPGSFMDLVAQGLTNEHVKPHLITVYEQAAEMFFTIGNLELVVAAPLLLLAFLAWLYSGPAPGRRRGKVLEVSAA
jgi:hypothetical protein